MADVASATEDTALTLQASTLLANDTDANNLTPALPNTGLSIKSVGSGTGGTVSLDGTSVVFTPTANFNGAASFTYVVTDGSLDSAATTVTVNVAAVNDAPTLTATAANPTFTEGTSSTQAAAVNLFSAATASTVETDQTVTGFKLTVSGLANGTAEKLLVDGSTIGLTAGTGTTVTNGLTYTVTVDGSTATVVFAKSAGVSATAIGSLISGLQYQNTNIDDPTAGSRVVTLTEITDSGSNTAPNVNVTTLTMASTVTVTPVNDAPVNTVLAMQATDFAAALTLTGLSVADSDIGSGMLTVVLSVANGKLTVPTVAGGATITTNGSTSVTLTGTVAAINASLAGNPLYTPDYGFAGAATLTVTTSDNGNTGSGGALTDMDVVGITVNAPVALQTFTPNTGTNFGSSDASTALPIDNRFILVGDDEANVLRVYERSGGPAVAELPYGTFLGINNNELDLEGSTQIGNTLYFIGSHGNSRAGADANNREHIFSATVNGTGAATTVSFTGQFNGLEAALVSWDQTNAHGLGANRFGFAASAVAGSPERNAGLGIEGLTSSADGSALWVGFRAPVTGGPALNLALIVPITNIGAVLAGTAQPVFGNAIQLDLGGRGIRSIEHNASGQYIIVAGPTGNASADVADDFRLYIWDGSSSGGLATNLQQRAVALDGLLLGGGSFETIVQVPVTINDQAYVQLLQDDGGVLVGGTELKDLPPAQQYFNGNFVQLGAVATDSAAPLLARSSPADGATGVPSSAQLVLTFNEPVRAGTGNLVLTPASGPVITLAANAPGVVYEYNTITITSAAAMLQPGTVYALTAAPGVVLDAAGNPFGGLAAGELDFTTAAAPVAPSLIITEVNSNPGGTGNIDFFELFNFGSTAIDLTGWRVDDDSATFANGGMFPAGTILTAGGRLVAALETVDPSVFRSIWNIQAEIPVVGIGGSGLGLGGSGDAVVVFNASGGVAASFSYRSTNVTASDGTVIMPSLRSSGGTAAGGAHAGISLGGGTNTMASAVWDGVSTSSPAYTAAAVGQLNAYAQSGSATSIGSPGLLPADRAPAINSNGASDTASINYAENGSAAVTTVSATDANLGDVVGFSITGGADAARFSINPTTGVLTFLATPDFEAPTDVGLNNVYDVVVSARDRIGLTDTQAIAVTVTDLAEGPAATLISAIQGEGAASSLVGQTVTVQARVTAWVPGQNLFYLMEETADRDGNVLTSEGIAVAYTGTSPVDASSIGDIVRLSGVVAESFGQTQITYTASSLSVVFDGTAANLEAARVVTLPIAIDSTLERHEGEYITVQSTSGNALFVAETFTFARFGETTLYADAVPFQFTEVNAPSVSGNTAYLDFLARNSIQIDDGSSASNPSLAAINSGTRILRDTTNDGMANGTALGDGGVVGGPVNFIRVGDTTSSVTGVLGFSFGAYDLTPTQNVNLTANPRPPATPAPDVGAGAEVKVASFNVLNYFTTLGTATFTNPSGVVHEGRGATNTAEFTQQQAKIVAAMLATGAHVFGLNELQNNGDAGALASLVNALNAAAGSNRFAAIGGHATGTDAIRVGIVYDQTVVQPLGLAATPNTTTYSAFAGQNRLPVAQTFGYLNDDSKQFTVVVNHLKSKGGTGTGADADLGDGAGQFNATRLAAVQQLNDWLNTNPTGATDGDYLLVGDLNSYRREAPVTFLEGAGYTLAANPGDYSYLFDGLRGSLDHILTRGLNGENGLPVEITGFTHFNINADEQVALDYNDEFGDGSVNINLDRNDLYRSSDHDPVVIGLRLNSEAGSPTPPPPDVIAPTLASSTPTDNAVNVAAGANIVLTFSENVRAGSGNIVLNALDPATPDLTIAITDPQISISGNTITINPTSDLVGGQAYAVNIAAGVIEDLAGNDYAGLLDNTTLNFTTAATPAPVTVFINEIHYDNASTDEQEMVTVAGPAGTNLSGWTIVLYNGSNGAPYAAAGGAATGIVLSGIIDNEGASGFGELTFAAPGIQNGGPDGLALVNNLGQVMQFLSYEGSFTAVGGPANGMTSVDIGVAQAGTEVLVGGRPQTLQLTGTGSVYSDFTWRGPTVVDSFGTINSGQTFVAPSAPPPPPPTPAPATAPSGTDATLVLAEDATRSFSTADFAFTDTDTPTQVLAAVRISSLPALGTLSYNGVAITQMQISDGYEVLAANLGLFSYTPAPDGNGTAYATFTFQVRDTGSTANDGVNLDATPNTLTFNVTPINDAPVINGVPVVAQMVTAGTSEALADFTLLDVDGDNLTVTLTTTNGTLNGLTDADALLDGIQLSGSTASINTAIARATFTATAAAGTASIGISVSDSLAAPVTATYSFTAVAAPAPAPVMQTFTENFDTLASSGTSTLLPNGWFISEMNAGTGSGANTTYTAGTGSGTAGDTYSFGAAGSTDRALGGLQSGTLIPSFGAMFENTTGQTVVQFDLAYTGEQWRLGSTSRTGFDLIDRLDFQYSLDATSLTTGTWTNADTLDLIAPVSSGTVGLLNGNAAANRTSISSSVSNLSLNDGGTLWIRWTDFNVNSSDDGLAIDDFSITLVGQSAAEPMMMG